jgi:hypothetical protein
MTIARHPAAEDQRGELGYAYPRRRRTGPYRHFPRRPPGLRRRIASWLARNPAWPLVALLAGYPLWWALGLTDFIFALLAIPMAAQLFAWRAQKRRVKLPPAYGLWLLFLLLMLAGVTVLTLTAPDTVNSPVSHRAISFVNRAANYVGVTVLLLYAGNLTERELSRRRLAWLLGLLAIFTVAGGIGGMLAPSFQFKSPAMLLLPHSVQSNPFIQASMQPGLAQIQNVLGVAGGRPKAPFDYTNTWGDCLSILLPWLLVGWWVHGTRRQRLITAIVLVAAVPAVIYSLNRGVWIGIGLSVCYLAVRMAARGRLALLGATCSALALTGILIFATPLHSIVAARLSHGKSNSVRSRLAIVAVRDAESSPVIGYGDTRQERGSPNSIAIGPTANCPLCGQYAVGSNGQLWLLLVCTGFVGTALYFGFFAVAVARYRRDTTAYGMAGLLVLLLSFVYMFTYVAVVVPLGLTMLSYALLWRNSQARQLSSGARPSALPREVT